MIYQIHRSQIKYDTIAKIQEESRRAIAKHGFENTPASAYLPAVRKFSIVHEEFGEVHETYTYDKQTPETRKHRIKELIQLATTAALWAQAEQEILDAEEYGRFEFVERVEFTEIRKAAEDSSSAESQRGSFDGNPGFAG